MADSFPYSPNQPDHVSNPARRAFAITPGSSVLANITKALYVGGAGNVRVLLHGDTTPVTFVGVPAGTTLPIRAKIVYATDTSVSPQVSTTATSILGLY